MTDLNKMELLPCPWCGDPLASVSVSEGSTFRWRRVQGCCTDGPEVRHDTMADDQQAAEVDSRRRAIEAWNTRAAPSGYVLVPVELINAFPKINPNNYDHDDACKLNAWACELVTTAAPEVK